MRVFRPEEKAFWRFEEKEFSIENRTGLCIEDQAGPDSSRY